MARARSVNCCCTSVFTCGACLSDLVARNAADFAFYPQAWIPGPHPSPAAVELQRLRRRRDGLGRLQ
jgi:hypothetical protein